MNTNERRNNSAAKVLRLGALVADYWRRKFPTKTAPHLAARCGVCIRQAENWLAGFAPATKHMATMIASEGRPFIDRVIHPFSRAYEHERITLAEDRVAVALADERGALDRAEGAPAAGRRRGRLSRAVQALGARLSGRAHAAGWEGADHAA